MKKASPVKRTVIAVISALLVSFVIAGVMGLLVRNELLPISFASYVANGVVTVCVFAGCMWTIGAMPQRKLVASLIVAVGFVLTQLLLGSVVFPISELKVTWIILLPVAAAVFAGVWSSAGRRHRR